MHMETEILPVHHNLFPESLPFCRWGAGANIDKGPTIKPFIHGELDYLHLVPSDKRDHCHRGPSQFALSKIVSLTSAQLRHINTISDGS